MPRSRDGLSPEERKKALPMVLLRDLQAELEISNQALRERLKRMEVKPVLVPRGRYMVSAVDCYAADFIRKAFWKRHKA